MRPARRSALSQTVLSVRCAGSKRHAGPGRSPGTAWPGAPWRPGWQAGLLALWVATAARAAVAAPGAAGADAVFLQTGRAEHALSVSAGAAWDWSWRKPTRAGWWTGYWEVGVAGWRNQPAASGPDGRWFAQVGLTPVLRFEPQALPGLFLEGGIGANLVLPRYRTRNKQFTTLFNFGDHLAVGGRFGERRQHELALRFEHFSNGGIKKPNPGENFVQLRYQHHF